MGIVGRIILKAGGQKGGSIVDPFVLWELKFTEPWTPVDFMGLLLFPETWTTYPPDMELKFSEPWSS